jgi:hypothetical protein
MNAIATGKTRLNPRFIEEIRRTLTRTVSLAQNRNFGRQPKLAASIQSSCPDSEATRTPQDKHLIQNYYQLIGVAPTAGREEIANAARKRADELKRAYAVLLNEHSRAIYDSKLEQQTHSNAIARIIIQVFMNDGSHNSISL